MNSSTLSIDKSPARVRRMFLEIADRYDLGNHVLSLNIDRLWRRKTVRRVAPQGTAPILDLCTGTGDLLFAYARRADPRTPLYGADFCPEMLRIAQSKARRQGLSGRTTFVEADAAELPFAEGQFQIVSVAFGLRNVADTDRALAEMHRVCRPGGRVAILEFSTPKKQPMKSLYGFYFRHVLPRLGQLLNRNRQSAYDYLPASVGAFPDGHALADRMRSAGLQGVWFQPLTFEIATLYVGQR